MSLVWQKYVPAFMATQYDGVNGEEIMSEIGAFNVSTDENGVISFDDGRSGGRQLFIGNWVVVDSTGPGVSIQDSPPWVYGNHIVTSPSAFYATDTTQDFVA